MVYVQFVGGHLDDVPNYAENIIAGVGIAMLNWARLEQQLDALLIHVNKENHSSEPYKPLRAASFRLKIELFERWFVKDPRFLRQRKRAAKLAKSLTVASADRNLLAHSNVQAFFKGPPVRMSISKVEVKGADVHFVRGEWTEDQIFALAKDFNKLSHGLWTISNEVFNEAFLESLQI